MRRLALCSLLLLMCCSKSPTGRRQLILVSDAQMADLGTQAFEQMKQMTPATTNTQVNAYVQCVAGAITAVSGLDTTWEIVVFQADDTVNAFALPGGKIGVYTGLLQVANTPGELAAVLGHEVSHVVARHSAERASRDDVVNVFLATASSVFGNSATAQTAVGVLGIGSEYGVALPFSRTQEAEADELGQELMAKAGFDPMDAVTLWQRMMMLGGNATPKILSDHPTDADRQAALTKTLPKADEVYEPSKNPNCQM